MIAQPHDRASQVEPVRLPDRRFGFSRTIHSRFFNRSQPSATLSPRAILDRLADHAPPKRYARLSPPRRLSIHTVAHTLRLAPARFVGHAIVGALVLLLIGGSGFPELVLGMDWTQGTAATATDHQHEDSHGEEGEHVELALPVSHSLVVQAPVSADRPAAPDALVPSMARHAEPVDSPWLTKHTVVAGDTLGGIAALYKVNPLSLIWSNNLTTGILPIGQELRVPRLQGLPHVVGPEETLDSIAERYGVAPGAIRYFPPNGLVNGRPIAVGEELFVPNGHLPIGTGPVLPSEDQAALMTAIAVGVVVDDETNVRTGPGTIYDKLIKLNKDVVVKLQERHEGWVKILAGETTGWISADLLTITSGVLDQVPVAVDIPPPPTPTPLPAPTAAPAAAAQAPAAAPAPAAQAPAAPAPPPPPSNRWVWPTRGDLTSGFGYRGSGFHNGIDVANAKWTPIVAARGGTVIAAGWCSGYGYCVKINHGGGLVTEYGHMASNPTVWAGQTVAAGKLIGYMGMTYDRRGGGYASGVHLHFTVKMNGSAVNPLRYLP